MSVQETRVDGECATRFEAVRREFEANFELRDELGASVAVYHDGKLVVDLWGGLADLQTGAPWTRDTAATVFSTSKGVIATCLHLLIDRGLLDPHERVARYWPQFAEGGKAEVTVAMIMSHQAGLPYWQKLLPEGALYDWEFAAGRLAAESPVWEPGTCHGYHAVTLGFLEGEILRRVTGRTIGQFLRDELAGPLGADVWIGLPEAEEFRVARLQRPSPDPNSPVYKKRMADPAWEGAKMRTNTGGYANDEIINSRPYRAAEVPATGAVANARGLATLYAALAFDGALAGRQLISPEAIPRMSTVRSAGDCDFTLRFPTTYTLGFSKSWGDRQMGQGNHAIVGEAAFGTVGRGGSFGFADPRARISISYVMNRMGQSIALNDRGQSLIDAAYRSIGFQLNSVGVWDAAG